MNNDKKQAKTAAAAVMRVLAAAPGDSGVEAAAEIIDLALRDAAREQERRSSGVSPMCRRLLMLIYPGSCTHRRR